ncbi:uncharacterized protein LOC110876353 isoform X2 [Helianthus annuus]|uniref:uncharacterized protein LOC110876353 isoform X2 n=1 Tax=Helianthus annuus TaxID=4232 RepID=UPI001652F1BA|nr:uncharacterized protein LOC110876353 isoform X2 [Helianthus annuus]
MAVLDDSCELCSPSDEIVDVSDKERSPKCLKLDSPEENEFPSPTGLSHSPIIEEPESSASDKTEAVNKQKFAILNTMASTYALRVDPLYQRSPSAIEKVKSVSVAGKVRIENNFLRLKCRN